MGASWSLLLGAAALVVACGGGDDPAAPPPIDPKVACETRAAWKTSFDCLDCQSRAAQPACDCNPSPFGGVCLEQNIQRSNGCAQAVLDCTVKCDAKDCACIDACYVGADACRQRTASFDGCIVQTCAKICTPG